MPADKTGGPLKKLPGRLSGRPGKQQQLERRVEGVSPFSTLPEGSQPSTGYGWAADCFRNATRAHWFQSDARLFSR